MALFSNLLGFQKAESVLLSVPLNMLGRPGVPNSQAMAHCWAHLEPGRGSSRQAHPHTHPHLHEQWVRISTIHANGDVCALAHCSCRTTPSPLLLVRKAVNSDVDLSARNVS